MTGPRNLVAHANSHGPLARLADHPKDGQALWDTWHGAFTDEVQRFVTHQVACFTTTDDNQHGAFALGAGWKRIGGEGIDSIGLARVADGPKIKLGRQERVNLTIDGHDGWAREVDIHWLTGELTSFWVVQANLGRHDDDILFLRNARALLKAFGPGAVYGFDEIDEADAPDEHADLRSVFTHALGFDPVGWGTMSPVMVGPMLHVVRPRVKFGSPGMAHVSPDRPVVSALYAPAPKEKS